MVRRYLPLWSGAVLVGLAIGIGPSLWPQAATMPTNLPSIAPQTMLQEQPMMEDQTWAVPSPDDGASPATISFGLCHTGGGTNCVVDGDTIWMSGQNVRIADIDTPETHDYRCPEEKALGDRAAHRLHELVNSGTVTLQPIGDRDADGYGRKLRLVLVNGTSVGDTLVSEGLARYYEGRKQPWC